MAKQTYSVCPGGFKNGLPLKYVRALSVRPCLFCFVRSFPCLSKEASQLPYSTCYPWDFLQAPFPIEKEYSQNALHLQIYSKAAISPSSFPPVHPPFLASRSPGRWASSFVELQLQNDSQHNWGPVRTCFLGGSNIMFLQTNQVLLGFLDAIYHGWFVSTCF